MIRGIYNSVSGMITQKKKLDVVTNNLANSTTPGFKEDKLISSSFSEMYIANLDSNQMQDNFRIIGTKSFGVHIDEVVTSFASGYLEETGLFTDLALQGSGFFEVETPDGAMYTRSGKLKVSPEGILVTTEGHPVMGEDGYIQTGFGEFSVDEAGNVFSTNGNNKIKIVDFENMNELRKQRDNLYVNLGNEPFDAQDSTVKQGFLESSNVDLIKQMIDMIEITRSFEINQRMVKIQDERLGKSVNEIGRV